MKAIDRAKQRFTEHQKLVEFHELKAQELFKYAATFELNSLEASDARRAGRFEKEKSKEYQKCSERVQKRLKRLGEKLSVFRTPTFAFGNPKLEDHSIPI